MLNNFLSRFRKPKDLRVKLSAIAKDEAAYLPMWVFHHLRMGFDEIEIYLNLIEDNSVDVCRKISAHYPLVYRDANYIYDNLEDDSYQKTAYRIMRKEARADKFTYLMFLDLDELLCSTMPGGSIRQCLTELNFPDVVSFQWALKSGDTKEFGLPLAHSNCLHNDMHVKSVFKPELRIQSVRVHNVVSRSAKYVLSDGEPKRNRGSHVVQIGQFSESELKPYFVLHRIWRSQLEYVAHLAKGSPDFLFNVYHRVDNGKESRQLRLKSNRLGYERQTLLDHFESAISHAVDDEELLQYEADYQNFIQKCELEKPIAEGQQFVKNRARDLLQTLSVMNTTLAPEAEQLFRNVDIEALSRRLGL